MVIPGMPKMPAAEWKGHLFYIGFIDAINFSSQPISVDQHLLNYYCPGNRTKKDI